MAAGEAMPRALTPDVYNSIEIQASRLESGLRVKGAWVARAGSLLTIFFCNFSEAKASDTSAFARFFHSMLDAGVVLPPSRFEAWFASAEHDDGVIDVTLEAAAP